MSVVYVTLLFMALAFCALVSWFMTFSAGCATTTNRTIFPTLAVMSFILQFVFMASSMIFGYWLAH